MIEESYSEPISVVVPLYNKVNEVCRAIDSVFSQTVQDFELIIVDGGSTDGSLEAIQKYIDDERFTLIHQKSKGVASGRNEGIVASKYDMIAFLDADDEWYPTFLEMILYLRKKYPEAGLYATAYAPCYGDDVGEPRLGDLPKAPWDGILPSYFKTSALAFVYPFLPSSVAIPKKTFEIIGMFNPAYRIGEDAELWGRIALEYPIAFTSVVGTKYSMVAENKLTDDHRVIVRHPFFDYLKKYPEEKLKGNPDYENILFYLQKEEIAIALNNLYAKSPRDARNNLRNVTDKRFAKYKFVLSVLSYLPKPVLSRILPIANRIGRK